jgi:hypothetical protein
MSDIEAYRHIREFEADYDRAQGAIRRIASVWILAGFGALGVIIQLALQQPGTNTLPPSPFMYSTLIGAAAIIGLYLLWYVDQNVYQRLLHTVFVYGLALEHTNPDLPQIRTSLYAANLNISQKLGRFYKIPIFVFYIIVIGSIFFWLTQLRLQSIISPPWDALDLIQTLACTLALLAPIYLLRRIRKAEEKGDDLVGYYGSPLQSHLQSELNASLESIREHAKAQRGIL